MGVNSEGINLQSYLRGGSMLPREQGRDFEGFFRTDGWDHGRIYGPTRALEPAY